MTLFGHLIMDDPLPTMPLSFWAQQLRVARKKAGLSQIDFAQALSVSQPTVHHWEKGNRMPTPSQVAHIAKLLGEAWDQAASATHVSGHASQTPQTPQETSRVQADHSSSAQVTMVQTKCDTPEMSTPWGEGMHALRRIAFQGLAGAYSHQAIYQCFPQAEAIACTSFDKALDSVRQGESDLAMIPIENSLFGRVSDIHHLLPNASLYIIGEYFLPIKHMLLGTHEAELHDVQKVISHPQALGQTRQSLRSLNVETQNWYDTAGAAQEVAERGDKNMAAIASEMAAERYGLKILRRNIEDQLGNVTRFIMMSRRRIDPPLMPDHQRVLTSLMFTVRSIPAGLYKCIGGFSTQGVNIIKLESYVPFLENRRASFYVEIEGNPSDMHVQQALDELGYYSTNLRILGVYSAAKYRQQSFSE